MPNFLNYRTKAKQAEVKMNLKAIYTTEVAYRSDNNSYSKDIILLGWFPVGNCRYRYTVGGDFFGNNAPDGPAMNNAVPGADENNFTAVGWGNIDTDPAVDTWQATSNYTLDNVYDDTSETDAI